MNIHVDQGGSPSNYPFATERRILALLEVRKAAAAAVSYTQLTLPTKRRVGGGGGGDPDLEASGDEEPALAAPELHPSAGWVRTIRRDRDGDQTQWAAGHTDQPDLEEQCEDEGAQCDDEGADDDREFDDAERGIADKDAVDEFSGEIAASRAFREDRAIRRTGRPEPAPAWRGQPARQINAAWSEPHMNIPQVDGTLLVHHQGETYRVSPIGVAQP